MRVIGLVQARMGSSRIPGKVLEPIGRTPMVLRIAERVARARHIDDVALTTSTDATDDRLAEFAASHGLPCFRGAVDDIVSRLHGATAGMQAKVTVRVWGDCPFVDAAALDEGVDRLLGGPFDFVTNAAFGRRTYPPGLDFEVYRAAVLEAMNRDCVVAAEREFPVEFVRKRGYAMGYVDYREDLSSLHLTVDYPEDLAAVRAICAILEPDERPASFAALIALLRARPELAEAFSPRARNIEYKAYLARRETAATGVAGA